MKVGVVAAPFTVTSMVTTEAHWPAVGVKVYVVVPAAAVLIVDGLQMPFMLFSDVVGSVPGISPTQYGPS